MKRKIIAASVVALAGLGIFLGGRTANAEQQLSDMQMANIEALTAGEEQLFAYVHPVQYPWGIGCNCTGKGNKKCCDSK